MKHFSDYHRTPNLRVWNPTRYRCAIVFRLQHIVVIWISIHGDTWTVWFQLWWREPIRAFPTYGAKPCVPIMVRWTVRSNNMVQNRAFQTNPDFGTQSVTEQRSGALRKRVGLITQRSEDRNLPSLSFWSQHATIIPSNSYEDNFIIQRSEVAQR